MLALAVTIPAAAKRPTDVTIQFDITTKEFTHWYEGLPTPQQKPGDLHPYYEGVHFYRGQTIHLQLVGAKMADLFSVGLTVADKTIPSAGVLGAGVDLPAVKVFDPALAVELPSGVTLATEEDGGYDLSSLLYARLDDKEWKVEEGKKSPLESLLENILISPAGSKKALEALAWQDAELTEYLQKKLCIEKEEVCEPPDEDSGEESSSTEDASAHSLWRDLETVEHRLEAIRKKYGGGFESLCQADISPPHPSPPNDFTDTLEGIEHMAGALEQVQAFRERIVALDVDSRGKAVADMVVASRDPALRPIRVLMATTDEPPTDECSIDCFLDAFESSFDKGARLQTIKDIEIVDDVYQHADAQVFLEWVNKANSGAPPPDSVSLIRLRKNLEVLAGRWDDVAIAIKRVVRIKSSIKSLESYWKPKNGRQWINIPELQGRLNLLADSIATQAFYFNCVVKRAPLPFDYTHQVLGRWYGNKEVTVALKQGTRVPFFNLGKVGVTSRIAVRTENSAAAGGGQSGPAAPAAVGSARFEIHNIYYFQIGAGFIVSTLQDDDFALIEEEVGEVKQRKFVKTRDRGYHFLPTVEFLMYPTGRTAFPFNQRYSGEARPSKWKQVGILAGFSMTDPTQDFFLGTAWMPRAGFGLKAGLHLGFEDALPDGISEGQVITAPVFLREKLESGIFGGITLNGQLFKDLFSAVF